MVDDIAETMNDRREKRREADAQTAAEIYKLVHAVYREQCFGIRFEERHELFQIARHRENAHAEERFADIGPKCRAPKLFLDRKEFENDAESANTNVASIMRNNIRSFIARKWNDVSTDNTRAPRIMSDHAEPIPPRERFVEDEIAKREREKRRHLESGAIDRRLGRLDRPQIKKYRTHIENARGDHDENARERQRERRRRRRSR